MAARIINTGHRPLAGSLTFVAVAVALAWIPALLLEPMWAQAGSASTRLLRASVIYGLVLGWQPIVAYVVARRFVDHEYGIDHGVRDITASFRVVAVVAPLVLLCIATGLHLAMELRGEPTEPSTTILAFIGVLAILWMQAFAEELGWRGYLLGRLMRRLGPWRGLILHAAFWGLWYAPLFFLGQGDHSVIRFAGFMVTCALLGSLLGWLRLASGSVRASAAANAVLTICAGLPLLLHGVSLPRSAIYGPVGWIPLSLAVVFIVAQPRLRSFIKPPTREVSADLN